MRRRAGGARSYRGQQLGASRYIRYPDAARCLADATEQRRWALAEHTPPAIAAPYEDADVQACILAVPQIAESLSEFAVARPAAMTGGHFTEIALVHFTEVNRGVTGEQRGAGALARIGEQSAAWVE